MLVNLQKEFWAALYNSDNAVLLSICEQGNLKPSERIEIYRTNVRLLHVSVLMSVYPICEKILGSDYFKQIAKTYVQKNPSKSFDLNQYGDGFPAFLQKLIEQRAELTDFQYLADLAQLEWQIQEVYFSADNIKLDMTEFQSACAAQAGEMNFSLQASVSVFASEYPIAELWEMHQSDAVENKAIVAAEHEYLCIFRDQYQVSLRKIDADLFRLITAIQDKKTLSDIAELFVEAPRLNAALEQLIKNKWIKH
ncbi:MAG: putative DNA-binding domain-containing protein [Gammaproteobacteria bacterium]